MNDLLVLRVSLQEKSNNKHAEQELSFWYWIKKYKYEEVLKSQDKMNLEEIDKI